MGPVTRIISGGQTGADRAALDWALHVGIPIGGWCPLGRLAEDGKVPEWYDLRETASPDYAERTGLNIRDSSATVVLTLGDLRGGSALTVRLARLQKRPWRHIVGTGGAWEAGRELAGWLAELVPDWRDPTDPKPFVLNVAGPRASKEPRIVGFVHEALSSAANALDPR